MSKSDIKLGLKSLKVKYKDQYVGTLALTNHGKVVSDELPTVPILHNHMR